MSRIDKMFVLTNTLSPIATTVPPEGMPKEEVKFHKSTLGYVCCICNDKVKSGVYHIHKSLLKQTTNNKRGPYATTG